MVEGVGARLAVIEVWWGDPFGGAVGELAGSPAAGFDQRMMLAAGKRQVIDIACPALGEFGDVVHLREVAGHVAAGMRTATILGVQNNSLSR